MTTAPPFSAELQEMAIDVVAKPDILCLDKCIQCVVLHKLTSVVF